MNELSLGRKIYVLREERKLSQSKLEVEAGLSFGTISRIENGVINPTKETIIKIAQNLNLNESEFGYLLNIRHQYYPNEGEIKECVSTTGQGIITNYYPAYLIDNSFRVWSWNDKILEILGIEDRLVDKYIGKTCVQILFARDLKIIDRIPKRMLYKVLSRQVWSYRKLITKNRHETFVIDEIAKLKSESRTFKSYWEDAEVDSVDDAFGDEFYITYKGNVCSFLVTMNRLKFDERFSLVRYFPKDVLTSEILQGLNKLNAAK
jgi:transcriptional regulator with XRE-family HTH domain